MGSYKIRGSTTPNMNASTTNNDAEAPPPARVSFENAPEAAMEMSRTSAASYETRAKAEGMRYTICDVPPLSTGVLLGFQHLLTMLSATVLIPLIVCPPMGATPKQTADVISTIFVAAGLNTLIQTTIGDRLPIVQGGSFAYLPPTFSIIFNSELQAIEDDDERFKATMQVISGALLVVGFTQVFIGYSGAFVPLLKYITPVTIAPVITVIGLSLFNVGWSNVSTCFPIGLTQIGTTVLFSQYLKKINVGGYPVFALFPLVLAICLTWAYASIMTASDVWDIESQCRTDGTRDLIGEMPWFQVPYPFQYGALKFRSYAIFPMMGGMMAGMIESVGDYYSVAKLSGAPPPTPGIVSRGIAGEGLGIIVSSLLGTAAGSTSYSENIAAISLTRVGSRSVVQAGAVIMIFVGVFSKASAFLASMPPSMAGGIYCVLFGLIVAVGLSNLQYINLNSERNLFIVGFAIFNALSIAGPAGYFATQESNPFGTSALAEIALSTFCSPMIIALVTAVFFDNTIEGSRRDRGMTLWSKVRKADVHNDNEYIKVYGLPRFLASFHNCGYLEYFGLGHFPEPPTDGVYRSGQGDLCDLCCGSNLWKVQDDEDDDGDDIDGPSEGESMTRDT